MNQQTTLLVVGVLAVAALGVAVYVATRPPPAPPPSADDALGGILGAAVRLFS